MTAVLQKMVFVAGFAAGCAGTEPHRPCRTGALAALCSWVLGSLDEFEGGAGEAGL